MTRQRLPCARGRKYKKRRDIASVGSFKRRDISGSPVVHLLKVMAAGPIYRRGPIGALEHFIGHDAGMASIAVGERMNEDHAMMQAQGSLDRIVGTMLVSIARIVDQFV